LFGRRIGRFAKASVIALIIPHLAAAQDSRPTAKTFLIRRDVVVAGAFLAAAAGLSAFDPKIASFFRDTTLSHVRVGRRLDDVFTHVNETTLTAGGIVLYGAARLTKANAFADVAFHATESVVVASLASQLIRGPLGRSRPRETVFRDQYDFHPFQGFGNFKYRSTRRQASRRHRRSLPRRNAEIPRRCGTSRRLRMPQRSRPGWHGCTSASTGPATSLPERSWVRSPAGAW
jgi:hypothetical protein